MDKAQKRQAAQDELIFNVTEDLLIAMEDAGISRADLARRLNKSKSRVSQMLTGNANITLRTLVSMCFELGVDVDVRIGNEYSVRDPRSAPEYVDADCGREAYGKLDHFSESYQPDFAETKNPGRPGLRLVASNDNVNTGYKDFFSPQEYALG